MKERTLTEKVRALQRANPKLSVADACRLLGKTEEDLQKENPIDFLKDMFGGKK